MQLEWILYLWEIFWITVFFAAFAVLVITLYVKWKYICEEILQQASN